MQIHFCVYRNHKKHNEVIMKKTHSGEISGKPWGWGEPANMPQGSYMTPYPEMRYADCNINDTADILTRNRDKSISTLNRNKSKEKY